MSFDQPGFLARHRHGAAVAFVLLTACGAPPRDLPAPRGAAGPPAPVPVAAPAADAEAAELPEVAAADEPVTVQSELRATCAAERSIVVFKGARLLELRCGEAVAGRFEVSLGFSPDGHKQAEGDGRTPEGEYFISRKFVSGFHRSLQLAYPNLADADHGLSEGVISPSQHAAITQAVRTCREPPQNTPLGSLLQIHGGGGGVSRGDWTLGCVALDNDAIEQVFAFHRPGCTREGVPLTPVRILP
jgi:hypothetical protein